MFFEVFDTFPFWYVAEGIAQSHHTIMRAFSPVLTFEYLAYNGIRDDMGAEHRVADVLVDGRTRVGAPLLKDRRMAPTARAVLSRFFAAKIDGYVDMAEQFAFHIAQRPPPPPHSGRGGRAVVDNVFIISQKPSTVNPQAF